MLERSNYQRYSRSARQGRSGGLGLSNGNMELSKYIKSESVELNRSAIHFADYNPRKLSDESRKTLKRGIKKFGLVGGIVVNKRTGLTVVSGHQRLSVMDELQKFPITTTKSVSMS